MWILLLAAAMLGFACGGRDGEPSVRFQELPESFSFFEVGVNTPLSGNLRKDLRRILGDDATQGNNVIDLELTYPGFLDAHLPDLSELNRRLNFPPRERVEHRTTRLMYRYSRVKGLDFAYVEILFSDHDQSPLLIRADYRRQHPEVLESLVGKYGPQTTVAWDREGGPSHIWRQNGDLLILSLVPDQFGTPATQVLIVFEKRLQALLAAESTRERERDPVQQAKDRAPF
jgi:hypothetical protein